MELAPALIPAKSWTSQKTGFGQPFSKPKYGKDSATICAGSRFIWLLIWWNACNILGDCQVISTLDMFVVARNLNARSKRPGLKMYWTVDGVGSVHSTTKSFWSWYQQNWSLITGTDGIRVPYGHVQIQFVFETVAGACGYLLCKSKHNCIILKELCFISSKK